MKRVLYVRAREQGAFPEYSIPALERALSQAGLASVPTEPVPAITLAGKVLSRIALIRQVAALPHYAFLVPMMGPTERRLWPVSYLFEAIPYCYDCWPPAYGRWERIFRRNSVRLAFFSASQSARYFAAQVPGLEAHWLPEAVATSDYSSSKPLSERRIHVLEMGRRFDEYNTRVAPALQLAGMVHLFERVRGHIIFPTRKGFIDGLGDSQISICFPSSVTHPERSGDVETLTHRYLESIASKCVVVGHCPKELETVFGYNPVVEADLNNPADQLMDILANIEKYQAIVDRNYQRLVEVGTWEMRVEALTGMLKQRGYLVPTLNHRT
jgi:hypothetical protein